MDPDVQQVLGFYSHYVMLPGYTPFTALRAALARFPGIPPDRAAEIGREVTQLAQIGEAVARGIEDLWEHDPGAQLATLLGGIEQPAPTVAVRVIGTIPLANNQTRIVSAVISAPWGWTAQDVKNAARRRLTEDSVPSAAGEDVVWTVRGPTLAQSPNDQ